MRTGASLGEVVRTRTSEGLLLCGLAGALSSVGVSTKRVHRLPEVLGAATLGFWAGYVIQSKGWFYQSIPVLLFGAASLAASVEHLIASLRGFRVARPLPRAGIAVVALIVLVSAKWIRPTALARTREGIAFMRTPYSPMQESLLDELSRRALGEPVYMFSTNLFPAFPAVNLAGVAWPYRYGFLWPLPAFYPEKGPPGYRKPEAQSPVERRFFETVVNDLLKRPPRLLVVERGPFKQALGSRPFDFIEYFSGSPDFVELMRGYRPVGYVGSLELYERARY